MRKLRRRIGYAGLLAAVVTVVLLTQVGRPAAASNWPTNYKRAVAESRRTGKPILADFSGSDWCGWCIKLQREVFDTPVFQKWAEANVVLLHLDFPRGKRLSEAVRRQNEQLRTRYGVRAFPTLLFLTAEGAVVGRAGYREGGPRAWIAAVQPIVDKAPKSAKLDLAESLSDAAERAARSERPLLLLGGPSRPGEEFGRLLADSAFARFANARFVNVRVDTESADAASAETLAALRKKHALRRSERLVLLLDPAGNKVLYHAEAVPDAAALQKALQKALPGPEYDGRWLDDFAKAKDLAGALGRPVLLDFTGSDWCGFCIKLDREVFSKPEFRAFARERLVLMKVDLPQRKKLPAKTLDQNRELARRYGVRGFPTLVLVDADGREIRRITGFPRGGLEAIRSLVGAARTP